LYRLNEKKKQGKMIHIYSFIVDYLLIILILLIIVLKKNININDLIM